MDSDPERCTFEVETRNVFRDMIHPNKPILLEYFNATYPISAHVFGKAIMSQCYAYKHFCCLYRNGFKIAAVVIAMVATLLGFIYPSANAVALMMLGAPCVSILWKEIQRYMTMIELWCSCGLKCQNKSTRGSGGGVLPYPQ